MRPVFIGGVSRSGTTLLGSMLGAHSACLCTPESQFKTEVWSSQTPTQDDLDLRAAFEAIRRHWRFKIWETDVEWDSSIKKETDGTYAGLLRWFVAQYGRRVDQPPADIWVDHTPTNVKHQRTLSKLFPEAQYIHIVRDGRAVAASVIPLRWGPHTVLHAAPWWLQNLAFGLALEANLAPDQIRRVRYEDLVAAPQQTMESLCSFLGLDHEPTMVEGSGFQVPEYTRAQHELVGQAPTPSRISKWESTLRDRDVEMFESATHQMLEYLGYEARYGDQAAPPTRQERMRNMLTQRFQGRIRKRLRRRQNS